MRAAVLLTSLLLATTASPDDGAEVKALLASIAGKENRPAGEVFKNVKLLKDVPAARFLRIMENGYNRALGVGCDHCHVEDGWDLDEKRPKRAAREMILLVRQINESLGKMEDVDTSDATVNCTTCHRGFVKPAVQMR